jgi:hypothetical protein
VKTSYEIRDASGRLVAYHVRLDNTADGKKFWWEQPDGSTGLNGTRLEELPLYGAHLVSDVGADEFIVICEGEKARDALERVKIPAVGTVTGAAATPGPEALEVLRDRRVCLWPDNDAAGRAHMERIGQRLQGVAAEVRIFTWHDAEEVGVDAAEHHAVESSNPKAVDRLLTDLEGSPLYESEPKVEVAPVGRMLSEVEAERVDWFWRGRIPKGKLTMIEGDPGEGKSAMTTDFAARKSVGRPWPDGEECEAGGVVLCSAEDGVADTIRPRLDAARGDPERVLSLVTVSDGDDERLISIPEDLEMIRQGIDRVEAEMVVIDPLSAFLSGDVNSHRDQEVRRALAPLAKLTEETGVAVVVVRHLTKSPGGNPLYRGQGSIGIIGAARSALLVAKHPEDEGLRVLAPLKSNLTKPAPSLAFALVESANGAVRLQWKGTTEHTAAVLLAAPTDPEERSALDEAMDFLRDVLGNGPVDNKLVRKDAREADISESTLKRAKAAMGISSKKGADGSWTWRLLGSKGIEGGQTLQGDHLDPLEPLPAKGALFADQEDQGDQEAQGDEVRGDERLAFTDNDLHPQRHCIHDVQGGCWLCKMYSSEAGVQTPFETTTSDKELK